MALINAKQAGIDGIACLTNIRVVTTGFDNAVACSDSKGGVIRAASNKDWQAAAIGFGHTPPKLPGETFQLTVVDAAGNGWQTDNANGAIVDRCHIFCRSQQSRLFYYELYFSAAEAPLTAGAYGALVPSAPNPYTSLQQQINIDGVDFSTGEWDLDIIGLTTPPVWPSDGDGWAVRKAGNIDCKIGGTIYPDDPANLPSIGDFSIFKLYTTQAVGTTAATFWEIKWAHVLKVPHIYEVADDEARPHIVESRDFAANFSGYVGGVEGYIKRPALTTYWPA